MAIMAKYQRKLMAAASKGVIISIISEKHQRNAGGGQHGGGISVKIAASIISGKRNGISAAASITYRKWRGS
jgi:hypothetical protein